MPIPIRGTNKCMLIPIVGVTIIVMGGASPTAASAREAAARTARGGVADGPVSAQQPEIVLHLELCVREDGTATPLWTEGIAVAIGREAAEAFEREHRPLTAGASAWLKVLETALPRVAARAPELASLVGVEAFDATLAAGNRGSSDGFGWVPRHIGINLEAFHETYGLPDESAIDRMTRIVAHEYVHLLTYARYPDHRKRRDTPLNRALWTIFFEGIGDYISVSKRWLPDPDGGYSTVTARTLRRLEPIFVERLEALVSATAEEEEALRRGIAMGKFDEKWGSLPLALWLHSEAVMQGEQETLRTMIRLERYGVLPLALQHAAPELRPRLEALQQTVDSLRE